MLEHKRLPYERIDILTLLHPVVTRLHGFDAGGQTRAAGGHRTLGLRFGDRLGTVPALDADGQKISTNHGISRFLDERHPEPPLFPTDREKRAAVEKAESWANEELQMEARRIVVGAALRDPDGFARKTAEGRMGYLLYRQEFARRVVLPRILAGVFAAPRSSDAETLARLPAMLDRIDSWIEEGVIGGEELNAADFMIAPSLALILYRSEVLPEFEGRPSLELVDRLLPEPAAKV